MWVYGLFLQHAINLFPNKELRWGEDTVRGGGGDQGGTQAGRHGYVSSHTCTYVCMFITQRKQSFGIRTKLVSVITTTEG